MIRFICLVLVLFVALPCSAGELAARLAAAAEREEIVVALVPNLGDLLKKADRLGEPFSANFTALFPLVGPRVFRSSQTRYLDLSWPIAFFLVAPLEGPVRFAYTAGSRNSQAFLYGLGKPGVPVDGVTPYAASDNQTFYAASLGDEVLVSDRRELAVAALKSAPAPQLLERAEADIELDLALAKLLAIYSESLELAKADFFQRLESLHNQPGIAPKEMRTYYGLYFLLGETFGRQIDTLALGLQLDGGDLVIRSRIRPQPGLGLDRVLQAQTGLPELKLVYVPKEAAMALGVALRPTPELIEALIAMLDPFAWLGPAAAREAFAAGRSDEAPPTPIPMGADLRRRFQEFYGAVGPRYATLILPTLPDRPGLRMVTYFDYSEPSYFFQRFEGMILATLPSLVSFYRDLGWGYDMWLAPSLPTEMPEGTRQLEMRYTGLSKEQADIFDSLYGGTKLRTYVRLVGTRVLAVSGPDAAELMQDWQARLELAQKNEKGPESTIAPPSGYRIGTGFLDLRAYLQLGLGSLPKDQLPKARHLLETYFSKSQQLFFNASTDGKVARIELRYPLESTLQAYKAARP